MRIIVEQYQIRQMGILIIEEDEELAYRLDADLYEGDIKSVRDRFLQWRGSSKDELNEICKEMIVDKENILDVVRNENQLAKEKKKELVDYLNSFFDEIETKGI